MGEPVAAHWVFDYGSLIYKVDSAETPMPGVVYVARDDNHAVPGPAAPGELAAHITRAAGASGSNRDDLLQLADALCALNGHDTHVEELATLVRKLIH